MARRLQAQMNLVGGILLALAISPLVGLSAQSQETSPAIQVAKPEKAEKVVFAVENKKEPAKPAKAPAKSKRKPKLIKDILVSNDGKTLHLAGAFSRGIAHGLREKLLENPNVKTLVLSSDGGQIIEGLAVANLVRKYGLDTHVEHICASACTIPFLNGKRRTISSDGVLGFHQASSRGWHSFATSESNAGDVAAHNAYLAANLSARLMEKAAKTPSTDMWYADSQILKTEGAVTAVVKPNSTRIPAGSWKGDAAIEDVLGGGSLWQTLRQKNTRYYHRAVSALWIGGVLGKDIVKAERDAEAKLKQVLFRDMAYYPDAVVAEAVQLENDLWSSSTNKKRNKCKRVCRTRLPMGIPISAEDRVRQQKLIEKMVSQSVPDEKPDRAAADAASAEGMAFTALVISETEHLGNTFCRYPRDYYRVLMQQTEKQRVKYFRSITFPQPRFPR